MGRYLGQINEEEITEIMKDMKCRFKFRCLKKSFQNIKFNKPFEGCDIFKCQYEKPQRCSYSYHYGYCYICKCPMLNHIDIVIKLENDLKPL